jgi:hypothetical protein
MAGRNISATHIAFTSTRVMATCAVIGQAMGTAAAYCLQHQLLLPRQLAQDQSSHVNQLQQILLRDDQTIRDCAIAIHLIWLGSAEVVASGEVLESDPASVVNGFVRDLPGQWANRWGAPDDSRRTLPSILNGSQPQTLRHIQITFDTGFHRELTLTHQDSYSARMIRAPQPETVRDYQLLYRPPVQSDWITLGTFTGNHQRLRRHTFEPFTASALRLHVLATNGSDTARVYELRCYA